ASPSIAGCTTTITSRISGFEPRQRPWQPPPGVPAHQSTPLQNSMTAQPSRRPVAGIALVRCPQPKKVAARGPPRDRSLTAGLGGWAGIAGSSQTEPGGWPTVPAGSGDIFQSTAALLGRGRAAVTTGRAESRQGH